MTLNNEDQDIDLAIRVDDRSVQDATDRMRQAVGQFQTSIERAFSAAISGGKSFDQILKQLALSISSIALKQALTPITQGFSQAIAGGLSGGLSDAGGGGLGSFLPFANGGVVETGQIRPFARGGVLSSPAFFPLSDGLGLAGEAGPEAILPLARGPDGRLGVRSGGGGAGPSIVLNVTTPDAASFRQSEAQVTALLARAVGRGQRGL